MTLQTGGWKRAAEVSPDLWNRVTAMPLEGLTSLSLCFLLGWESDRVGFLHYKQGVSNLSKSQIAVLGANDGEIKMKS